MKALVAEEIIEKRIFLIRGQKVMLDSNLSDSLINLREVVRNEI